MWAFRSNYNLVFALIAVTWLCSAGTVTAQQNDSGGWGDDSVQESQKALKALNWVVGPKQVQMFGNSTLEVPKDYLFLGTADTEKLQAMEKNLGSGKEYFFAPSNFRWQGFFSFQDDGYVKDNEAIDADAILKNIKENTLAANDERRSRGYDEVEVLGWQTPPHYDAESHHLEWAVRGEDRRTHEEIVNFNTRILGRGGVMSVVLVSAPQTLAPAITNLKETLSGFEYQSGQRYAEYKPGDKIAKYGLAALVTGGAAAVAVKTGLWKVILAGLVAGWKFIAAAVALLFGSISKFFKRKAA